MNRYVAMEPATDAELFDMMHALLGIGDFDEESTAWYQHRGREIAKLKRIRAKRQITLRDYAIGVRYCYRHRVLIRGSHEVCKHISEAKAEIRANAIADIEVAISNAVAVERHRHGADSPWISRLLNARGPYRREVLESWTQS